MKIHAGIPFHCAVRFIEYRVILIGMNKTKGAASNKTLDVYGSNELFPKALNIFVAMNLLFVVTNGILFQNPFNISEFVAT